ncbi:peptidoglycan-binding protein [Pedobacter frigoris]|uniref:Peptidoglycan-binding protein n=1 Tax=Pedobacter frigoris TaxID=2571272 RepID=A0A4U1CKW0_9SPHI|nr:peptidoglycan-binding protein [Pedobacter frigoris]
MEIARKEIGVREATNRNDGQRVEGYLGYVGFKKGAPYCAAFLSWCFGQAGYSQPRTAWSPALFPASRLVKEPLPGIVYGLYYAGLGRIGHCGLVENVRNDWVYGAEGNTNEAGGREGQGVYRKIRHKRTIHVYSDWVR